MTEPHTLRFLEIWRPVWLSNEPRVFYREMTPKRHAPGPWRVMETEFARRLATLPNPYFTLDDKPGVTFCARRFRDKQASDADREAVRALRAGTVGVPQMPRGERVTLRVVDDELTEAERNSEECDNMQAAAEQEARDRGEAL